MGETDYVAIFNVPNEKEVLGVVMALKGDLLKYSSQYVESGKNYISKLWDQTRAFKIFIEDLSVKGRLNI
jgi:hypothetical protein